MVNVVLMVASLPAPHPRPASATFLVGLMVLTVAVWLVLSAGKAMAVWSADAADEQSPEAHGLDAAGDWDPAHRGVPRVVLRFEEEPDAKQAKTAGV